MIRSVLSISSGAAVGALLRWQLGVRLNYMFPALPPGTLVANALGGLVIGVAVALLAQMPHWSPMWRLLIITGFCGGLTTFSTFSAEVMASLQAGRINWALLSIAAHVSVSLIMTFSGMIVVQWWLRR